MGSLVFFAFVIGIDLLLKSMKDKKKIESIREKKMQELKNKENNQTVTKTVTQAEGRVKREIKQNPSIAKHMERDNFHGEGKSYKDNHEGYKDRYDQRYESIAQTYEKTRIDKQKNALYDKNSIRKSGKNKYEESDIRNYGRDKERIEVPVPTVSTFKNDVLNGIIFSEILGKPKSLQKK